MTFTRLRTMTLSPRRWNVGCIDPAEQRCRRIPQALLLAATLISGASAALFGFLYFSLYWPYRGLFNEEGRYFDGDTLVVHHEQTGLFVVPALAFLVLAFVFAALSWIRRRSDEIVANEP